jgi:4-hydroxythreonine-4-phosphate dehydrogenase
MSRSCRIKVGITIGDPSGIGPAITSKAMRKVKGLADFVVIGDAWVFKRSQDCRFIDLDNVGHKDFKFGKIRAEYGRASIEYLDKAMELIKNKEVDCLVTCPISKEAINLAGFHYNGHTEYLAKHSRVNGVVMMLLNKYLRFSLVTRHLPLREVSSRLNQDVLYHNIILTCSSLSKLFLIKRPHIVVCGLNPHASDNGTIGEEENRVIKPVIKKLKRKAMDIEGPLPADIAVARAYRKEYDCVIAMYHDQALIPLKLSGFDKGVNITLGLPFVRTSPLHGTAFDIAGNYRLPNPNPLIEAIELAVKCTTNLKRV